MSIFNSHLETLCGVSLESSVVTIHPCQKWMDETVSSVFLVSKGIVQLINFCTVADQDYYRILKY